MMEIEKSLTETLGTRVVIENRPQGGRLLIEFFSPEDLTNIVAAFAAKEIAGDTELPTEEAPIAVPEPQPADDLSSVTDFSV